MPAFFRDGCRGATFLMSAAARALSLVDPCDLSEDAAHRMLCGMRWPTAKGFDVVALEPSATMRSIRAGGRMAWRGNDDMDAGPWLDSLLTCRSSLSSAAHAVPLELAIERTRYGPPQKRGNAMEYRQFGRTGPEGFRHRLRLLGNQRHLRSDRRGAVRPGRASCPRCRHQLLRYRRSVRHGHFRAGARPRAGCPPTRRLSRHQGRRRLSGSAQSPRQQSRADHGLARAEPAESRHRSRRRLSDPLAGSEHAVRGNDARAR